MLFVVCGAFFTAEQLGEVSNLVFHQADFPQFVAGLDANDAHAQTGNRVLQLYIVGGQQDLLIIGFGEKKLGLGVLVKVFAMAEGEDIFMVQVDEMAVPENPLVVYPNPTQSEVHFRFEKHGFSNLRLELFGLNGQRLRDVQYGRVQEFTLERESLPSGIFFFRITSKGSPVAVGKVVVE